MHTLVYVKNNSNGLTGKMIKELKKGAQSADKRDIEQMQRFAHAAHRIGKGVLSAHMGAVSDPEAGANGDKLLGFVEDEKTARDQLTKDGNDSIIATSNVSAEGSNARKIEEKRKRELRDSFNRMVLQQTLYESMMDRFDAIADPYERMEAMLQAYEEIKEELNFDGDWAKEAKERGLLSDEELAECQNADGSIDQEKVRKLLAEKAKDPKYGDDPLVAAAALEERIRKEAADPAFRAKLKARQEQVDERVARAGELVVFLDDSVPTLYDFSNLPTLEEQHEAIQEHFKEHPEMVKAADANNDGTTDAAEMIEYVEQTAKPAAAAGLEAAKGEHDEVSRIGQKVEELNENRENLDLSGEIKVQEETREISLLPPSI